MTTPDAADESGFVTPTTTLKANREVSDKNWEEIGDADMTCLNTATSDVATTALVTLNTQVTDFQTGNAVPNAEVVAFKGQDLSTMFDTKTADGSANVSISIPSGVTRYGFKMTATNALPTLLLNQYVDPANVTGGVTTNPSKIQSVSNATAATLSALIGQTRTPGTSVVAGALRDCQGREVSGFIATVSTTKGSATLIPGAQAYYFNSSVGLPGHHNQVPYADKDGLFMIIQLPATAPTGYVQMWGFPTKADLDMGMAGLKLIAELEVPLLSDTVITGSYEPLRN
ncbi:MAG: hypothetical protein HOV81_45375 [Kofleriaceae bacterium]|nr:hypothetical protein [Kofleriaceae bacterium]